MVRIRFRRVGAKKQASFRIVAADKESPRDGRFLEVLGYYNPRTEPSTIRVDEARLFHWMQQGAQPSDSVVQTLTSIGTWERWERLKGGESLETLLAEAEAAMPEVDPRTRRDDLVGMRRKKRKPKAAEKPEAPPPAAKAEQEPEAEAPEAAEAAEPEAEAPEAAEAAEPEAEAPEAAEAAEPEAEAPEAAEAAEPEAEAPEAAAPEEAEVSDDEPAESEAQADADEPAAEDESAGGEGEAEAEEVEAVPSEEA